MPETDQALYQAPPTMGDAPAGEEHYDAQPHLKIANDELSAEMWVDAPVGEGAHITLEELRTLLLQRGVSYGIDQAALERLAAPTYGERLEIARGNPAVEGTDGSCTELFDQTVERTFAERADGTINYKELGLIRDVKEGTIICNITLPVPGVEGHTVTGETLTVRQVEKAAVPAGENTRVSEDGLRLEAATRGNLVYRDGRFNVETVVRVQDVNLDTGNIAFSGDVQVNGDVMDGFEVTAGGSINLRGQAGAVVLKAGGNITVERGLNGSDTAVLQAAGELKAGFIENATLIVGEKLIAQTLMNCQVECEGDVDVSAGKGIICGGKVTARGSVKARTIGNEYNTPTTIVLGVTPKLLKERKRLTEQLEDVNRHLEELTKNIEYINKLVKEGRPVPEDRVQKLKRAQISMPLSEKKRDQLQEMLDQVEQTMLDVSGSTLVASVIHPPTKVTIGVQTSNVTEKRNGVRVYKNEAGELTFGKS